MPSPTTGILTPPRRIFIDTLPPATLILVSTTPPTRTQLQNQLTHHSRVRLLASSTNLTHAIPLVMCHRPDILLLEHHNHVELLLPLLTKLKKTLDKLAIILYLHDTPKSATVPASLHNLCAATLTPPHTHEKLAHTIELVSCGYTIHMTPTNTPTINGQASVQTITVREHEILRLLCLGLNNRDIAQRLFLAESTIKSHTTQLKNKLHAHNRICLALAATRYGLV